METKSLPASVRTGLGKSVARKVRRSGGLPGIVYQNGGASLPIVVDPKEFQSIFRRTANANTLVQLELDGSARVCLVKDVQRHPVTYEPEHVDFFEVKPDRDVFVKVKVRPVGTAAGTKVGGTLRIIHRELDVVCKPGDIPEAIDVDVTEVEVGKFVRASQIAPPTGCQVRFAIDFNVITVVGKQKEPIATEEKAEAGEAEAETESED